MFGTRHAAAARSVLTNDDSIAAHALTTAVHLAVACVLQCIGTRQQKYCFVLCAIHCNYHLPMQYRAAVPNVQYTRYSQACCAYQRTQHHYSREHGLTIAIAECACCWKRRHVFAVPRPGTDSTLRMQSAASARHATCGRDDHYQLFIKDLGEHAEHVQC
eukprot:21483-Heterococcus_DN1.PRE.1